MESINTSNSSQPDYISGIENLKDQTPVTTKQENESPAAENTLEHINFLMGMFPILQPANAYDERTKQALRDFKQLDKEIKRLMRNANK